VTEEEINEGNKIIALFMGWRFIDHTEHPHVFPNGVWFNPHTNVGHPSLIYHNSWDWLMEACKKWNDIRYREFTYNTTDEFINEIANGYIDLCEELDNAVTLYEILPAFEQLVKCVKWYNENIKR
jgi:hypothetical protein